MVRHKKECQTSSLFALSVRLLPAGLSFTPTEVGSARVTLTHTRHCLL